MNVDEARRRPSLSAGLLVAGLHLRVPGSSGCRSPTQLRPARRPASPATEIDVERRRCASRPCAVGMSKTANVAPPSESTPPNFAMPVIVNCWIGPCAATPIVSPTS